MELQTQAMEKENKNLIDEIEFNSSLREKWFGKRVHLSTMSAGVTVVVVAIIVVVVVVAVVFVVVAVAVVVVVAKTESSIH